MEPNKRLTEEVRAQIIARMREAGEIILQAHGVNEDAGEIDEKAGTANFVTVYDVKVQNFLVDALKKLLPEAGFLAEEKDVHPEDAQNGFCFVIDPIDGTTNFIHNYRCSVISVGLLWNGEPYFGAVYNPYQNRVYSAVRGEGAFCNGKPMRVSERPLSHALISYGTTPYYKDTLTDAMFGLSRELFLAGGDIRRSGSAAFDLCMVASGRSDVFFEMRLSPWDYAAGMLLITEAGGWITRVDGKPIRVGEACSVLAGNAVCREEVQEIARKYHPDEC